MLREALSRGRRPPVPRGHGHHALDVLAHLQQGRAQSLVGVPHAAPHRGALHTAGHGWTGPSDRRARGHDLGLCLRAPGPAIDTTHARCPTHRATTRLRTRALQRGRFRRATRPSETDAPEEPRDHPQAGEETTTMNEAPKKVVLCPIPVGSTPRSSCAGCRKPTAARWSPSPPTSARARSWSRHAPRRRCWACRTSASRTCARPSCATTSSPCSGPTPSTRVSTCSGTLDCAAAHRQAPDRDRARDRRRRRGPRRPPARANDQVRFELGYYAHDPGIRVIAPWREWTIDSREALVEYAERHQNPDPAGQARRAALLHRCQPPAHLLRGQGAGGPVDRAGRGDVHPAPSRPRLRRTHPLRSRSSSRPATRWRWTARRSARRRC